MFNKLVLDGGCMASLPKFPQVASFSTQGRNNGRLPDQAN